MTKAEQFEALALRCEQATEADGNLDKAILLALGYSWRGMNYWHYDNKRVWRNPSIFTTSLDAALTLVPEGYVVNLGNDKPIWAQVWIDNDPASRGGGTTMALALCAAALRARAQMERGE